MTGAPSGRRVVVVTGSTRGIGRALAAAFLDRGCRVVVSGRTAAAVSEVVAALGHGRPAHVVDGVPCDVGDRGDVQRLWDHAARSGAGVDVWVSNAGVTTRDTPFATLAPDEYEQVVRTNLLGVMNCAHVVVPAMVSRGRGQLWNMEGLGSGRSLAMAQTGPYSASKAGVTMLTRILAKEVAGSGVSVGRLSPGIVATDLVDDESLRRSRRFLDAVADRPETVAPWLVDRMLATRRNGARVDWLGPAKLASRLVLAGVRSRDPFGDRPSPAAGSTTPDREGTAGQHGQGRRLGGVS